MRNHVKKLLVILSILVYSNLYSEEIQNSSVFENNILYLVLFILIGLVGYSRTRQKEKV